MIRSQRLAAVAVLLSLFACDERPTTRDRERASPFVLADSLRDDGRFLKALPLYRALRDSFALAGDSANLWRAQIWWAYTLIRTNRTDSARAALGEAAELARGNARREAWTRAIRCNRFSRLGQSDSAIVECSRALAIARTIGDHELQARSHFQLGTIHSRLGHYRVAVAQTESTLALHRRHRHAPREVMGTLNSMGIEYAAVGRLGEAERMYQEGIHLADSLNSIWYRYHLHSNLASLRFSTGDLEEAVRLMTASLRGAEQLPDTQGMVYAHNSLAEFYLRAGNRAGARRHLESSLAMNRGVTDIYRVISLADLGLLEAAESPGPRAEQALLGALRLADAGGYGAQRATIRAALARLAAKRGMATAALRWADAAVAIADSLEAPEAQIEALEARAAALQAAGRSDASDGYLQGIELLESWRGRLALGDLRMGVAEPRWSLYEGAIHSLLRQGKADMAFRVAERARARLLLEVMAERDASRPPSSDIHALRRTLRERFEERNAVSRPEELRALDQEIAHLIDSLTTLEAETQDGSSGVGVRNPVPASVTEVQQGLLRPGRALLAFFWGDDAVYGWWITREGLRAARLGSSDSLAALIEFLRGMIDQPASSSSWVPPARAVFKRLLGPLEPTAADEVLVVADGPLAHIPIEVLIPADGVVPWGVTTRFVYGPSASVLLNLVATPKAGRWERAMLAVGNPTTSPRRPAVRPGEAMAAPATEALPYAGGEARAVRDLFQDAGADLLLGRAATPARWLGLDPGRYRYLHFAVHARVSDRRVDETHLVLSGGTLDLTAIRGLRLRADLVTLSACETALGRRVRGEGIIGLPHAFLAAGAHGTVVTLWRIADRSAADFMRDFYEQVHAARPAAEALLAVRRQWVMTGGVQAHPSQWAPFVLVGGISE